MTNIFLNIIIGLSALSLVALPYVNKLSSISLLRRVNYQWILTTVKTTRFKLGVTFLAGLLGIWATVKKDQLADKQYQNGLLQSQIEKRKSDQLHKKELRRLSADNLRNFGAGLAKYYLKYDSVSKEIKTVVRDSSKTKVIEANRPELAITNIKVHLDSTTFVSGLVYTATQSAIHNFDGALHIMVRDIDNNLVYLDLLYNNLFMDIALGTSYIKNLRFTASEPKAVSKIYYLTLGRYTDGKGNKYNCKILSAYLLESQETVGISKREHAWVMDHFKKNGIKPN